MIIDLPSDKGLTHLQSISRILDLPEFVKQADFGDQTETDDLPSSSYANQHDRKFPVHTKAAAYLSYAYFLTQKSDMPANVERTTYYGFQKAAGYWGLESEFTAIEQSVMPGHTKSAAAAPSKFALDLGADKFFPINTPSEIIKSADSLAECRGQFDYSLRSTAAKGIMKAAAAAGLPLSVITDSVHRMAGNGLTTKKAALRELSDRWNTEKRPSLAGPLHECIATVQSIQSDILSCSTCEKLAMVLDQYDRALGRQVFPEDVLFAFTKHAADEIANSLVSLPDGSSYWCKHLEKAADAFGVLGANTVRDLKNMDGTLNMTKVSELIDTLPLSDAHMLKEALSILGVRPATIDKLAVVEKSASGAQSIQFATTYVAAEPRGNVLSRLEASDPLVKRALNTLRLLKESETKETKAPTAPRGLKGLFTNKAPNKSYTAPTAK